MVEGPEGASSVFVRCLEERWKNEVEEEDEEGGVGVELRMRWGEVWVVRWEDVWKGVLEGELELLWDPEQRAKMEKGTSSENMTLRCVYITTTR
jgi:hypothetical protein